MCTWQHRFKEVYGVAAVCCWAELHDSVQRDGDGGDVCQGLAEQEAQNNTQHRLKGWAGRDNTCAHDTVSAG